MSVVPQIGKCLELVEHCDTCFKILLAVQFLVSILMQNHLYAEYIQIIGFVIVCCANCFGQKHYFVNAFATLSLQKVEGGLLRSLGNGTKEKMDSEPLCQPPFSKKRI